LFQGSFAAMARAEVAHFCAETNLFDPDEARRVMETADGAKRWYLMNLALWWRTFIAADSPASAEPEPLHA
jgi:hypothetical protein